MISLLLVSIALAGGPFDNDARSAYPEHPSTTTEQYEGAFDRPPVPHWVKRLPGKRLNSAAHTERARPVLRGGYAYVGSAAGDALYQLDRRSGRIVQRFPAAASVESEPVVLEDRLYFTDTGGRTWCYALSGEEIWSHDSKAPILVRPTVHEGTVYVTNVDDLALALDADTGELRWRYQQRADLDRQAELALYAAPPAVVLDDDVLVGFSEGSLVALDREHGDVEWSLRVGEGRYPDIVAEPTTWHADIFASGYFEPLLAIDRETRDVRWRIDAGSAAAPLVHEDGDATMLFHPGTDGKLRAIRVTSGDEVWSWQSDDDAALTTPVWTTAGLVVGSAQGSLTLLAPDDGSVVWRFRPTFNLEGVSVAPAIDGRQILFVTNAGKLYSFLVPAPVAVWPPTAAATTAATEAP